MNHPFLMTACAIAASLALGDARAQDARPQETKPPEAALNKVSVTGKRVHRVS